jgi:hypothetical protein
MHSLISPSDYKQKSIQNNQTITFTEEESNILKTKLNKDIRILQKDNYYCDPLQTNQRIGLVSFIPSSGAKPDSDGFYGMCKIRGCYATENEANERAEYIINNVDSFHTIYHTTVGKPFPLTERNDCSEDQVKIDVKKKATQIISEDILNKKKKMKEEKEILETREKALLDKSKKNLENIEETSFDHYITQNVKRAQLIWSYKEILEKLKQMKKSYVDSVEKIQQMDVENPTYKDEYLQKYLESRDVSGLNNAYDEKSFIKFLALDLDVAWDDIPDAE